MKKFKLIPKSGNAGWADKGRGFTTLSPTSFNMIRNFRDNSLPLFFPIDRTDLPVESLFMDATIGKGFKLLTIREHFKESVSDETRVKVYGANYEEEVSKFFKDEQVKFIGLRKANPKTIITYPIREAKKEKFSQAGIVNSVVKGEGTFAFDYVEGSTIEEGVTSETPVTVSTSLGCLAYQQRIIVLLVVKDVAKNRLKLRLDMMLSKDLDPNMFELWVDLDYIDMRSSLHTTIEAIIKEYEEFGIPIVAKRQGINREFYIYDKSQSQLNQIINRNWYNGLRKKDEPIKEMKSVYVNEI